MKVYIVMGQTPGTNFIIGVYSNRGEAESFILSGAEKHSDPYIEEHEVLKKCCSYQLSERIKV